MKKVTKSSVNYRDAEGKKDCGNCGMFNGVFSCDLVKGFISSEAICDRWTSNA